MLYKEPRIAARRPHLHKFEQGCELTRIALIRAGPSALTHGTLQCTVCTVVSNYQHRWAEHVAASPDVNNIACMGMVCRIIL